MIHITLYIPILHEHIKQIVSYCRFNSQDFPLRRFKFRVGQSFGILLLFPWRVLWSRPQRSPSSHHLFFHFYFFLMRVHYWKLLFANLWHSQSRIGQTLYTDIRTRKRVHRTITITSWYHVNFTTISAWRRHWAHVAVNEHQFSDVSPFIFVFKVVAKTISAVCLT